MAKLKKEDTVMDTQIKKMADERVEIEDMPLTSLREYRQYNEEAARLNKKLKIKPSRYPYKPCPVDLHPTQRIVFGRNDQPSNPLQVYISDQVIDFKKTLVPGQTYDLPKYVIHYLAEKGTPVWKWRTKDNGEQETFLSHKEPRFAMRTLYAE